jgi:hypothetical protein
MLEELEQEADRTSFYAAAPAVLGREFAAKEVRKLAKSHNWAQPRNRLGLKDAEYRKALRLTAHQYPGEYGAWYSEEQLRPRLEINYAEESGTWGKPWPKRLKVEHNVGRVEHLIKAVTGETVPLARSEREAFGPRGTLLPYLYLATPALRVIGPHMIAKHLGFEDSNYVSAKRRKYPAYKKAIHKIGSLFVSDVESLRQLEATQQRLTRVAKNRSGRPTSS